MPYTQADFFDIDSEYEDEFGIVNPTILSIAGTIWQKSQYFFSNLIQDRHECLRIMMKATILVSRKYSSETYTIENPKLYLYSTFKHLVMAEVRRQKRHYELESQSTAKQIETDFTGEDEKVCQNILIDELRSRMDEWTRAVFDLQVLGYQYKDLIPTYGASENVIRSKYSKNLLKLKNKIQIEMSNIERELEDKH